MFSNNNNYGGSYKEKQIKAAQKAQAHRLWHMIADDNGLQRNYT